MHFLEDRQVVALAKGFLFRYTSLALELGWATLTLDVDCEWMSLVRSTFQLQEKAAGWKPVEESNHQHKSA